MPSNASRKSRKAKRARREPAYITCLMVHGPPPTNWQKKDAWKSRIVQWWMSTITGNTPPETDRSGHRFYTRFMSWYHSDGKAYLTTVVKETDE